VVVGRGDDDAPGLERLAVRCADHGQRAGAAQDVRQDAVAGRGQVEHDDHGRLHRRVETGHEFDQRLHAAGGRTDDDNRRVRRIRGGVHGALAVPNVPPHVSLLLPGSGEAGFRQRVPDPGLLRIELDEIIAALRPLR